MKIGLEGILQKIQDIKNTLLEMVTFGTSVNWIILDTKKIALCVLQRIVKISSLVSVAHICHELEIKKNPDCVKQKREK